MRRLVLTFGLAIGLLISCSRETQSSKRSSLEAQAAQAPALSSGTSDMPQPQPRYGGYAFAAKGSNDGETFDVADTGPLPPEGGTLVADADTVDIPGGCVGNCDGQHPGMGEDPPIHDTTMGADGTTVSMASVSFVDVTADGYRVVADWLMPMATATCGCQGTLVNAHPYVGVVFIYDPSGEVIYSETTSLTETVTVPLQDGRDGVITINEVLSDGQSITVNALHVVVTTAGTGTDFVIGSAKAELTCTNGCPAPDPADAFEGPVDLYTGCVVLSVTSPVQLIYDDSKAALAGPTRGVFPPDGPTPYVAGKGWTLAIDESVESVNGAYVLHTHSGDIPYTTFVPSMGGYIATPSNGSVLTVTGQPPDANYVLQLLDKSKKFYGGNNPNNFIQQRGFLYKIEEYGGPDNPSPPTLVRGVTITRNEFAQVTEVDNNHGDQVLLSYAPGPGFELQSISLNLFSEGGPQLYGEWTIIIGDDHRIAQLNSPGADGLFVTSTFEYDCAGRLTRKSDPSVNTPNVTRFERFTDQTDPNFGKVSAIKAGTSADEVAIGAENLTYFPCGPNQKTTQLLMPYGEMQQMTFDIAERRLIKLVGRDGRESDFFWNSNGAAGQGDLFETYDPATGIGLSFAYDGSNNTVNRVIRLPEGTVLYSVELFQGQSQAGDPASGFLPTLWTDASMGLTYRATYDSLNRLLSSVDDINAITIGRTPHTLGVPGGMVDVVMALNGVAQGAVTLDRRDEVVATWSDTVTAGHQLSAIERAGDGAITAVANTKLNSRFSYGNFTNLRLPQTTQITVGATTVARFSESWNNWGQKTSMGDGVSVKTKRYAPTGETLSEQFQTGTRSRSENASYDPTNQPSLLQRNGTFSEQTFSNPPAAGAGAGMLICQ